MSVISNASESATSTSTEGFQIDSLVNQTLENSTDFSLEKGNSTVSDDNEWTAGDYALQAFIWLIVIAILAAATYGISYALDKGITNMIIRPNEMAPDEAAVFAPRKRRTKTNYTERYTKEEKRPEVRAPPPPVLHAKQDRSSAQTCKKKQPETEILLLSDNRNASKAPKVVQGTQNFKVKQAQPTTKDVIKNDPEKEALVVPKQDNDRLRNAEVRQCKTETKSNVPWYLQD